MSRLLDRLLRTLVNRGTLELVTAGAPTPVVYGDGKGTRVRIRIVDRATEWRLVFDPEVQLGEAFMNGTLVLEEGTIYDLLRLVMDDGRWAFGFPAPLGVSHLIRGLRYLFRRFEHYNPIGAASRRVRRHYDLSDRLFDLFLDGDRQYSCAYFPTPDTTLEEAQAAKKRHIVAKLRVRPGMRVLDIGSGWGGLGLSLGRAGCEVTGVTLSVGQHEVSNARAAAEGLADRVRFLLRDYRRETGRYDRVVSVGMLEHVGSVHLKGYFGRVRDLLTEDGVAVVHSIGRFDGPGTTNAWITRHIFPGGYIPAVSEVAAAIEKAGLYLTDVEILRLHYADTLKAWRERFLARRAEAVALYDERFARMWEFYLAASEASFRWGGLHVLQVQVARRIDSLPVTRDYMVDDERRMAVIHALPADTPLPDRAAMATGPA